jgi:hypothetical protein
MQILSLWFKITAFLALIGILIQCTGVVRDLGPWVSGVYTAKAVIDTVEADHNNALAAPPPESSAAETSKIRAVYKVNE